MKHDPFTFAKKALRKASLEWPERTKAIKRAYRGINRYECAECKSCFQRKLIEINHINPVHPIDKAQITMDEYVLNLFCEADGFNVLCIPCHKSLTMVQSELRKLKRKKRKKHG